MRAFLSRAPIRWAAGRKLPYRGHPLRAGDTPFPFVMLGKGPGLLLLPGLGEDRWVMAARWGIRWASAGFRTVAVDLPGVGRFRKRRPDAGFLGRLSKYFTGQNWAGVFAISYGAVLLVEGWLRVPARWWILLSPGRVSGVYARMLPLWTRWQVRRRLGGLPQVPPRTGIWPERLLVVLAGRDKILPPALGWAVTHRIPRRRLCVWWMPDAPHTAQKCLEHRWDDLVAWVQGSSSG